MDACLPAVYRPRRPRDSPLYRLVEDQFETLLRVHEEHFQPRYGRLRHAARRAVEKFLHLGFHQIEVLARRYPSSRGRSIDCTIRAASRGKTSTASSGRGCLFEQARTTYR